MRFILWILPFVLISCSLPGTQIESVDTSVTEVSLPHFNTTVPKSWSPAEQTVLPIPSRGNIELAYMAKDAHYGFSNNYIILSDSLQTPITSRKYSELNAIQTSKGYLEYTKIQEIPIAFPDTDTSLVTVFEARYNKTTPLMKFIQTAKVCGTKVYLLHIAVTLDKAPEKYIELFKAFTCK